MKRPSGKQQTVIILVLLVAVTLVVYWQVRGHDFIAFDDDLYVTENKEVQRGLTWRGIKWAFTTTQAYNWHPLVWISHMLDCQLYKLNPAGHHFTNVLFHIANTLLLFLVLARMTGCLWRSGFVAALFALHPLHVESVAWVSERKDVLSTFLWILTMWFYLRYVRRPRFATYQPIMLALALGLMAKQMLVTLPLVLLLLDYWPLERFALRRQKPDAHKGRFGTASFSWCLLEKLPLLALSAVASLIVFLVQSRATLVKSTIAIPFGYRVGNAILAYARYITRMFWPANLGVLYPHPETNLPIWKVLTAGLLLLCVSILVVRHFRSRRWFAVGWLWYLGTLVPVIGLVQVGLQAMADRYTYVPLIGLFIIIAWGAAELLAKQRHRNIVLSTGAVTVLSVLTAVTWRQVAYWQNSITLYKHTVAVTANNDILHYNLGVLLLGKGRTDEAIKHWREAVRIRPDQPTIHKNLATLLSRQGDIDGAIEHYRRALRLRLRDQAANRALKNLLARRERPDTAGELFDRGNALASQGELDKAIACYTRLLQLRPGYAAAHNNLGNALYLRGKPEQALARYYEAVRHDPNLVDAHYNMAVLLAGRGSTDEAVREYRKVLEIDPSHAGASRALRDLLENGVQKR
jgi:tetratricopeptide (TPR) repeat protein